MKCANCGRTACPGRFGDDVPACWDRRGYVPPEERSSPSIARLRGSAEHQQAMVAGYNGTLFFGYPPVTGPYGGPHQ